MQTIIRDLVEPLIPGMVKVNPIKLENRFVLSEKDEATIRLIKPQFGFGVFSEVVMYRTYSHMKPDGKRETFSDIIVRVINGLFSIRKNHYINNGLIWNEDYWIKVAINMGESMLKMHVLPPGRSLFICGREYGYQRGGSAFNNCGFCSTLEGLVISATWTFDNLMSGSGIGYDTRLTDIDVKLPGCSSCRSNKKCNCDTDLYIVHDSKEGWTKSLYLLLNSYLHNENNRVVHFDYSEIREKGAKINGFGGISSGYLPLEKLHNDIRNYMECFVESKTDVYSAIINLCKKQGLDYPCGPMDKNIIIKKYLDGEKLSFYEYKLIGFDSIVNSYETKFKSDLTIKEYQLENNEIKSDDKHLLLLRQYFENKEILTDDELKFIGYSDVLCKESNNEIRKQYTKTYGTTRLITDIFNSIGVCVVAGNVRRSSEIALGLQGDMEFLDLKNHKRNPERECISWMSNNTVIMEKNDNFNDIPDIAERIRNNGEPGIMNMINTNRFGRFGKRNPIGREAEEDHALGVNPCSEIPLESFEFCNLAEIFPTRCSSYEEMENAAKLATLFTSTIALLQTHWSQSNQVIARNRRTGVSISGIADLHEIMGFTKITSIFKNLYKVIRQENKRLAIEAGVPESLRCTCVKPSGTISLLVGVSPGIHFPTFNHCIRRIRISSNSELVPLLEEAGFKGEVDYYSGPNTLVFSFPLYCGSSRAAGDVSIWMQSSILQMMQREYADNCVSATLYFNPETESNELEDLIAQTIPCVKSLSILPHTKEGVYVQAPYEWISKAEYGKLIVKTKPINWSSYKEVPVAERGCTGDTCEIKAFKLSTEV